MAAVLLFDPLKFSKRLINVGVPPAQAEEFAEAQQEMLQESLQNGIASKEDIAQLDKKIDAASIASKEDIARLDKKIDGLSGKLSVHDWMLRFLLGLIIAIFVKMFF